MLKTIDGRSWATVGDPGALSGEAEDSLDDVVADGDRIVVVARKGDDLCVHTSADGGLTWRTHTGATFAGLGRQSGWDAAIAGDQVVVAGYDNLSGAVWVGPAP